ncbi:hypothetical protein HDU76_003961, partial [Blyttiomyces sp. JEL0837]
MASSSILSSIVELLPDFLVPKDGGSSSVFWIVAVVSVVVLFTLIGLLISFLTSGSSILKSKRHNILIIGLNDAGKTSLYTWLKFGKVVETRSSLTENRGTFAIHPRAFKLTNAPATQTQTTPTITVTDFPGHEKLRFKVMDALSSASKIVLVLDANNLQQKVRQVAELLMDVLSEPGIVKDSVKVLVVCNKSEGLLALPATK